MSQQKIGFYGQFQPTGVDTSGADRLRSLAGMASQVGDIAYQMGAKQQTKKGKLEGAEVERDEEGKLVAPEMQSDFTHYGESFNQSAILAYKAQIGIDSKARLDELQNTHKLDPEAFKLQAMSAKAGALSGMPPEIANEAGVEYGIRIDSHYSALKKEFYKRETAAHKAVSLERLDSIATDISTAARRGETEVVEALRLAAEEELNQMVAVGHIDTYKASQVKKEIYRESLEQTYRKGFADMMESEGVEAAQKALDSLVGKAPKEWTADEWDTYLNSQQADINRLVARQKAKKVEVDKNTKKAIDQYETAASLGFKVSPGETSRVKELVFGTPHQERFNRVNAVAAFSVSSLVDRNTQLNDLRTGELEDVADYSAMIKANSEINKAAKEDGYLLGAKQGLIEFLTFNPSDPESMQARLWQTDVLSQHYGVPISPLTDSEADGLSESINDMTPAEKTALANTLNEAPDVWGQIASKNQAAFAMVGSTGDNQLMMTVFKGQEMLAEKLVVAPKRADYLPALDDFVGDVYGTQDKSAIVSAAINHYAATANDEGIFDEGKFEESLTAVTGGIGDINGFKLELPRGVDEDDFEDFIDNFTPSEVSKLGGVTGYTDMEAAEVIQDGRIKSIGENKYIVMVNEVQSLFKPNGEPLIIEWSEERDADIKAESFIKGRKTLKAIQRARELRLGL